MGIHYNKNILSELNLPLCIGEGFSFTCGERFRFLEQILDFESGSINYDSGVKTTIQHGQRRQYYQHAGTKVVMCVSTPISMKLYLLSR